VSTLRTGSGIRRRKNIRLKEYDYSLPGEYFVTICTKDHIHSFGEIVNEEMKLLMIGEIADRCWKELPVHFMNIELDEFVVMPNHIHGIIVIKENDYGRDVQLNVPTRLSPKKGTLSIIIRTYKAAVTTLCRRNNINGFGWQSGYFDHIIRDEKSLIRIRDYIATNPQRWWFDKENSQREEFDQFEQWLGVQGQKVIKTTRKIK
jgi:putative transposase